MDGKYCKKKQDCDSKSDKCKNKQDSDSKSDKCKRKKSYHRKKHEKESSCEYETETQYAKHKNEQIIN